MTRSVPQRLYGLVALAAFLASYRLGASAERRMIVWPVDGQALYGQAVVRENELPEGAERTVGGPKTYQRLRKDGDTRSAAYGFSNFNRDKIEVSYTIAEKDFQPYNQSFGYTKEGLEDLKKWRENAKQSAFKLAVKQGKSQAQLDAAVSNIDKQYDENLKKYLKDHGFRMLKGNVVAVDMPGVVQKNAPLIKPLALAFEKIASRNKYQSGEIIGALLSFVQTAMYYKQPDAVFKDKHTGGVLPPITAVLVGWGDCDTKTGLLASLLSNWAQMRMIGVSVPGHYLMGVLLIPEKGDLFLEYQGLQYVLVEPAGPAWLPPGQVGEETTELLNGRDGYKLEPFY